MGFLKRFFQFRSNESDANQEMKREIVKELVREVRLIFNLALIVSAASAMMTLLGVGMLYFNQVQEGSVTTGAGILASVGCVQFAKDAQEELKKLIEDLQD